MAESMPVQLARKSLAYYLEKGSLLPLPKEGAVELNKPAGVFVSLKKQGELRGCIGTFSPAQSSTAQEIIVNAVGAGTQDPRFWPVELNELAEITISVDILDEPQKINSIAELDPQKYGVIVRNGRRSGLLLPMLAGIESVETQIAIAKQKAGIPETETVDLYRFTVTRYE
ncbi:AmmeMemoRadiSam system protein A [Anaerospora hongkongensis]|uniref:AmmeMemoRadiSam system protein A n=1 Tax=Anaerospora hongkongensis TaxID=244830 RepID=UPI00289AFF8C|nr:AmmeMemoRadiSam system protein A [Anaerospora hongkongensis]